MADQPGRKINIGLGLEASRGTAEATKDYWVPVLDADVVDKTEQVKDEASHGVKETSVAMDIVSTFAEGGYSAHLADTHIGVILKSLLGSLTSAANADASGAVYDHTITVGQSTVANPSLTVAYADDTQDYDYPLAVVRSIEISGEVGGYVDYTVNFVSKKGESDAGHTVAITSENRFRAQDVAFKVAAPQSGLDAAGATSIKAFSLSIENGARKDDVLGSTDPNDVVAPAMTISGSVTLNYADTTLRDLFTAGTARALRFDLTRSDVTIGTSANPEIKIDVHKATFANFDESRPLDDLVTQTIDFEAHYSTADSKSLTITLTNLVTAYT